jgi:hypothetical protein
LRRLSLAGGSSSTSPEPPGNSPLSLGSSFHSNLFGNWDYQSLDDTPTDFKLLVSSISLAYKEAYFSLSMFAEIEDERSRNLFYEDVIEHGFKMEPSKCTWM